MRLRRILIATIGGRWKTLVICPAQDWVNLVRFSLYDSNWLYERKSIIKSNLRHDRFKKSREGSAAELAWNFMFGSGVLSLFVRKWIKLILSVRVNEWPKKRMAIFYGEWPLGHSSNRRFHYRWMAIAIHHYQILVSSEWPWPFTENKILWK